jgi:hypothetical protein
VTKPDQAFVDIVGLDLDLPEWALVSFFDATSWLAPSLLLELRRRQRGRLLGWDCQENGGSGLTVC